jgi:hypothetical protein
MIVDAGDEVDRIMVGIVYSLVVVVIIDTSTENKRFENTVQVILLYFYTYLYR